MAESERGTKEPLDEGERGQWKSWLKSNIQKTNIIASGPITSWQTEGGKVEAVTDFLFLGSKITSIMVIEAMKFKDAYSLEENYDKPRQCFKKQRHYLADKGPYSQSSSHVWMWELDYKEGWELRNWCFWTVVLEKTPEGLLDCREIKPVNPEEISPEYSLERLMLKLKLQYLATWCEVNSLEKTLMLGKVGGKIEGRGKGWDG